MLFEKGVSPPFRCESIARECRQRPRDTNKSSAGRCVTPASHSIVRQSKPLKTIVCGSRTCKPNSVCRGNRQDGHSSRLRITARLKRPTRRFDASSRHVPRANPKTSSLFGLAPCGVCPACRIAAAAVRSYRTFSPLPRRVAISPPRGNEITKQRGGMFSVALSVSRA